MFAIVSTYASFRLFWINALEEHKDRGTDLVTSTSPPDSEEPESTIIPYVSPNSSLLIGTDKLFIRQQLPEDVVLGLAGIAFPPEESTPEVPDESPADRHIYAEETIHRYNDRGMWAGGGRREECFVSE